MSSTDERQKEQKRILLLEINDALRCGNLELAIRRTNDFNLLDEDPEAYFSDVDSIEREGE